MITLKMEDSPEEESPVESIPDVETTEEDTE